MEDLRDQLAALWDGQISTNHMLDDLRGRETGHEIDAELNQRLRNVEELLQQMIDQPPIHCFEPEPITPQETNISREPSRPELTRPERDSISEAPRRQHERLPLRRSHRIYTPAPAARCSSRTDIWFDLLAAPSISFPPPALQPPPQIIPFTYHPTSYAARPRSRSPSLSASYGHSLPPPIIIIEEARPPRTGVRWRIKLKSRHQVLSYDKSHSKKDTLPIFEPTTLPPRATHMQPPLATGSRSPTEVLPNSQRVDRGPPLIASEPRQAADTERIQQGQAAKRSHMKLSAPVFVGLEIECCAFHI